MSAAGAVELRILLDRVNSSVIKLQSENNEDLGLALNSDHHG